MLVVFCVFVSFLSVASEPSGLGHAGALEFVEEWAHLEVCVLLQRLERPLNWANQEVLDAYNALCAKWESGCSAQERSTTLSQLYAKEIDKESSQKVYEEGNVGRLQAFSLLSQLDACVVGAFFSDLEDLRSMIAKEGSFLCDCDDVIKGAQDAANGAPLDGAICADAVTCLVEHREDFAQWKGSASLFMQRCKERYLQLTEEALMPWALLVPFILHVPVRGKYCSSALAMYRNVLLLERGDLQWQFIQKNNHLRSQQFLKAIKPLRKAYSRQKWTLDIAAMLHGGDVEKVWEELFEYRLHIVDDIQIDEVLPSFFNFCSLMLQRGVAEDKVLLFFLKKAASLLRVAKPRGREVVSVWSQSGSSRMHALVEGGSQAVKIVEMFARGSLEGLLEYTNYLCVKKGECDWWRVLQVLVQQSDKSDDLNKKIEIRSSVRKIALAIRENGFDFAEIARCVTFFSKMLGSYTHNLEMRNFFLSELLSGQTGWVWGPDSKVCNLTVEKVNELVVLLSYVDASLFSWGQYMVVMSCTPENNTDKSEQHMQESLFADILQGKGLRQSILALEGLDLDYAHKYFAFLMKRFGVRQCWGLVVNRRLRACNQKQRGLLQELRYLLMVEEEFSLKGALSSLRDCVTSGLPLDRKGNVVPDDDKKCIDMAIHAICREYIRSVWGVEKALVFCSAGENYVAPFLGGVARIGLAQLYLKERKASGVVDALSKEDKKRLPAKRAVWKKKYQRWWVDGVPAE